MKHNIDPVDATVVRIKDKGEIKELDYDGAMTHHMNSLWWGTAVGYRAMQAAIEAAAATEAEALIKALAPVSE